MVRSGERETCGSRSATPAVRSRLRTPALLGLPGGYGLMVMDLLARRWGVMPRDGGKTVWFEVAPVPARALRAFHDGSAQAQRGR